MRTAQPFIMVSKERHPDLHYIYSEFASNMAANHTLLTLAEGLLRSGAVSLDKMLAQCVIGDVSGTPIRLRVPPKKFPELYRIYSALAKGIKSAVLTELLQYAARYRKENPVAATELLVNKTVIVEAIDMGEVQLPVSKEESVPEMEPDKPENDLELNGLNFDVDFSQF